MDPIAPPARADDDLVGAARCAVHPDVSAALTCPHCGSYACPECTFTTSWGERLCMACETAGRSTAAIPWDEGRNLLRTAWAAARSPKTFFGRFPLDKSPSLVGPLVFALVATLPLGVAALAIHVYGNKGDHPRLAISRLIVPILLFTSGPLVAITSGVVFGACMVSLARASGRRLPLGTGIRAGLYIETAWLFVVPFMLPSVLVAVLPRSSSGMHLATACTFVAAFVALLVHEINCLRWLARRAGASSLASWMHALASFAARGVGVAVVLYLAAVMFFVLAWTTIQAL